MKLLYNGEQFFCTRTELLSFRLTRPLAKADVIGARLGSNSLIFHVILQSISN